jgi:antitoxin FitA
MQRIRNGRRTEAEAQAILEEAVRPGGRVELGSLLAEIGRAAGLSASGVRDHTPARPLDLSE